MTPTVEAVGLEVQEYKMYLWEKIIFGTVAATLVGTLLFIFVWVVPNTVKCSNECAVQQDMPIGDFHVWYDECKCENQLFSFPHDNWVNVYTKACGQ